MFKTGRKNADMTLISPNRTFLPRAVQPAASVLPHTDSHSHAVHAYFKIPREIQHFQSQIKVLPSFIGDH